MTICSNCGGLITTYFMKNKSIAVVGLWHLGCVYAASLSKLGFDVTGFDVNRKVVSRLNKGIPPIFEPELREIILNHINKNLVFSNLEKTLKNKDYIFITHDVEVDDKDVVNMAIINKLFRIVLRNMSPKTVVVISSQVPVGTSRIFVNRFKKIGIEDPKVIYFPENLRLGQAFSSFLQPDRIILGSDDFFIMKQLEKDFAFGCPVLYMGLESAEMVKHALNSYLALCISFSSELSDLSEKIGVDMTDVVKALKLDKRISMNAPINPGLGFSGGTLGRDIQSLRKIAGKTDSSSKLLDAIYLVNKERIPLLVKKMKSIIPLINGKTIGILGLTYKPKTDTLRRSMSLELAALLNKKRCTIKAFDPAIKKTIKRFPYVRVCTTQEKFFSGLDMVVLMTDWDEFKKINPLIIASLMNNALIVDTKNFLDSTLYRKSGFIYVGIGKHQL